MQFQIRVRFAGSGVHTIFSIEQKNSKRCLWTSEHASPRLQILRRLILLCRPRHRLRMMDQPLGADYVRQLRHNSMYQLLYLARRNRRTHVRTL